MSRGAADPWCTSDVAEAALVAVFGGVMIVLLGRVAVMLGVGTVLLSIGAVLGVHCMRRSGRIAGCSFRRPGGRLLANNHGRGCTRVEREP